MALIEQIIETRVVYRGSYKGFKPGNYGPMSVSYGDFVVCEIEEFKITIFVPPDALLDHFSPAPMAFTDIGDIKVALASCYND